MKENQTKRFIISATEVQQLRLDGKDELLTKITSAIKKSGPVKKITITAQSGEE